MSEHSTDTRACDLLAAYELGLLDDPDRSRFETHLDDCPDCTEELYAFAPVSAALTTEPGRYARAAAQAAQGPLARLARLLESLFQPRILAPVATVAVVALLVLLPTAPRWGDLARVEPLAWSRVPVRAGDTPGEMLFKEGMDQYAAGQYAEAADLLGDASRTLEGSGSPTIKGQAALYNGISLLLDGRPQTAKGPLQAAAANPLPPVAQGAGWYLAQACLLTDKPDSASLALTGLRASPVYAERASALLARIQAVQNH